MNRPKSIHTRQASARPRYSNILGALVACATMACNDDGDRKAPGASGTSPGETAGTSGRGGASSAGAGSGGGAEVRQGGNAGDAGDTNAGGSAGNNAAGGDAGDTNAGGSAGNNAAGGDAGDMNAGGSAGDAGVGGQGGDGADCGPGYARFGGSCRAACAPHHMDGAQIALSIGHTDVVAAAYDAASSELNLFVSDDSFPIRQQVSVRRKPESVLVHGTAGAIVQIPDIPALSGIFEPETNIWLFPEGQPEAQAASILWPGLRSYDVDQSVFQSDQVTLRLATIEGAGKFVGFSTVQDEATPPDLLFDPVHGLNDFSLPVGTHLHLNWGFTHGGLHRLTFELEGTTVGGEVVRSAPHTYRFFFGDLAELPATEPTIVAVEGLEPSYAPGDELLLTTARHGAASALPAAWSRQCYEPVTFEPLPWEPVGQGDTLTTAVKSGCQYVACLMAGTTPLAISQAVLPQVQ